MARTIAVVSQKGGVGKTSLVQNVGAELARTNQRTLLVDLDPQSNLTSGWGLDPGDERPTVYEAMLNPEKALSFVVNLRPNLDLIPANLDLAAAELMFGGDVDRNNKLRKALSSLTNAYQVILVDGPPSLGFFTINALAAASEVLIPLQCQAYAYRALDSLLRIIGKVQEVNPPLHLMGVVLTMYDSRLALSATVSSLARERFGDLVFSTPVPTTTRIAEAPSAGVPVGEYEERSKGAEAYKAIAAEVLRRG